MAKIDLYLEEDIGLWTLDQFGAAEIGMVASRDRRILDAAVGRGIDARDADPNTLDFDNAPVLLSVHCRWIFRPPLLARYGAAYNLHPGYLPFCRGASPAFWALWKGEPAGATLHLISEEIDGGDIVDQEQVEYDGATTAHELYIAIGDAERRLLSAYRSKILSGAAPAAEPQAPGGTRYNHDDFVRLMRDVRERWREYATEDLLRLLRCAHNLPLDVDGRIFNLSARGLPRS